MTGPPLSQPGSVADAPRRLAGRALPLLPEHRLGTGGPLGHLLQHGEIPLNSPADLWQAVFGTDPPQWRPSAPDASAVETALISSFSEGLSNHDWADQPLSSEERTLMQQGAERYRLDASAL